jgi:hypothetical protein
MVAVFVAATLLLALGVEGAEKLAPTTESVASAFRQDGFAPEFNVTLASGAFGMRAVSTNVTLRTTGEGKPAFFMHGNSSEIGYLTGRIAPKEVELMAVHYVDHFVPALLSAELDMQLSNSSDPGIRALYDEACVVIGDAIVQAVNTSFFDGGNVDLVPAPLVEEMEGIVAGASEAGAANITLGRIVTLNYGMDFISAHAYAGNLSGMIQKAVAMLSRQPTPAIRRFVAALDESRLQVPVHCDAFAASGSATANGNTVFARGFQLPAAGAFEQANAPMIIVPRAEAARGSRGAISGDALTRSFVGAGAPGMVGMITTMNAQGFAMGVDTLRTGDVNTSYPGHASILLVRATAQAAGSVAEASEYVRSRQRGLSWLYPMADSSGQSAVLETGKWRADAGQPAPDLSGLVANATLRAALIPYDKLQAELPAPYAGAGVFVRNGSYSVPESLIEPYNRALLELAGEPWPGSSAFGPRAQIFPNFTAEDASWGRLASKYYSPSRRGAASNESLVTVVSNLALVPQLRAAEMTAWASAIPAHAAQWRFDLLSRIVRAAADESRITAALGRSLVSFLQPCPAGPLPKGWVSVLDIASGLQPASVASVLEPCTPGFWTDVVDPQDPRSAVVEGSLAVADLRAKQIHLKAGYWSDGWLQITLPLYLGTGNTSALGGQQ